METAAFVIAGAALVYWLVITLYAGITADFAWIWIACALYFGGIGLLIRNFHRMPGHIATACGAAAAVLTAAAAALFVYFGAQVFSGMSAQAEGDLDYVIVLGAQVRGTTASRALTHRLRRALACAEQMPDAVLVLSGGQGDGEDISEAECMRRWLTEQGVDPERLVLEDRSVSTREYLVFSDQLTGCASARTGIVSNNFHIYRAVGLARKLGYAHPEGIAASSDAVMQVHFVVREIFALAKEKLMGHI